MAQLNFPDPAVTTTYTEAGINWTWNATLGVWSAENADASDELFLSKVHDDTAAGEITFEGQTTHEDVIACLGQLRVSDGPADRYPNSRFYVDGNVAGAGGNTIAIRTTINSTGTGNPIWRQCDRC